MELRDSALIEPKIEIDVAEETPGGWLTEQHDEDGQAVRDAYNFDGGERLAADGLVVKLEMPHSSRKSMRLHLKNSTETSHQTPSPILKRTKSMRLQLKNSTETSHQTSSPILKRKRRMTSAERARNYRERMKEDPDKYEQMKERQRKSNKRYNESMDPERRRQFLTQKNEDRKKSRERQRQEKGRKRLPKGMSRKMIELKAIEAQRQKTRDRQRRRRAKMKAAEEAKLAVQCPCCQQSTNTSLQSCITSQQGQFSQQPHITRLGQWGQTSGNTTAPTAGRQTRNIPPKRMAVAAVTDLMLQTAVKTEVNTETYVDSTEIKREVVSPCSFQLQNHTFSEGEEESNIVQPVSSLADPQISPTVSCSAEVVSHSNNSVYREQVFVCDVGNKAFALASQLKEHQLGGESPSVPASVDEWTSNDLPSVLRQYEAKDIFNADETGLFYCCLPNCCSGWLAGAQKTTLSSMCPKRKR